jgi:hypothetical protein
LIGAGVTLHRVRKGLAVIVLSTISERFGGGVIVTSNISGRERSDSREASSRSLGGSLGAATRASSRCLVASTFLQRSGGQKRSILVVSMRTIIPNHVEPAVYEYLHFLLLARLDAFEDLLGLVRNELGRRLGCVGRKRIETFAAGTLGEVGDGLDALEVVGDHLPFFVFKFLLLNVELLVSFVDGLAECVVLSLHTSAK